MTLTDAIISRCAATASRAVTRWYAEHLYKDGTTLEEYVKAQVLKIQTLHQEKEG